MTTRLSKPQCRCIWTCERCGTDVEFTEWDVRDRMFLYPLGWRGVLGHLLCGECVAAASAFVCGERPVETLDDFLTLAANDCIEGQS